LTPPAPDDSPLTLSGWLARNAGSLVFMAVTLGLIFVYTNPLVVLQVAVGLGLVIFIHELGHFAAAKWCDVHVETFSIGFGPALPGCKFQYGETTYMIALVPLGGYVKMVGEGEGETGEEEEDPRSFKNKTVGQRMLIISAGVIMNIILACICFIIVYTAHGKEEKVCVFRNIDSGSPAWKEGLRSGEVVRKIGGRDDPWFDDLRLKVTSSLKDEKVPMLIEEPEKPGEVHEVVLEPWAGKDSDYPVIGVVPADRLTLAPYPFRKGVGPAVPGSAASRAEPPFEVGDQIVAMTDPAEGGRVTDLPKDTRVFPHSTMPPGDNRDYFAYQRRMHDLIGKPVTFRVLRDGRPIDIVVPPAYHYDFGMRMRMGEITAVRKESPAAKAGLQPRSPELKYPTGNGDRIKQVEVTEPDGTTTRFASVLSNPPPADKKVREKQLDPLRLPYELEQWAERQKDAKARTVRLTVLRTLNHKQEEVTVDLPWDDSFKYSDEMLINKHSPVPVKELGLAYRVEAIIDGVAPGSPAAEAGLQPDDNIRELKYKRLNKKGEAVKDASIEVEPDEWAPSFFSIQRRDVKEVTFKVKRGEETLEKTLTAVEDPAWPTDEIGLVFQEDYRMQKADGVVQALEMGARRTVRMIGMIYQNLRALVVGRISATTMSGPLTIASLSYSIAAEDLYWFIFFIGMISVNLAVINFLPIPVLDGGHMVFLIYEKLRGKPAPESIQVIALYIGLAMILSLMAFVLFLDVRRLFF
jgi:regulator of sigma E protease